MILIAKFTTDKGQQIALDVLDICRVLEINGGVEITYTIGREYDTFLTSQTFDETLRYIQSVSDQDGESWKGGDDGGWK